MPKVISHHDWSASLPKFVELEVLAYKADQVAKATMLDLKSQCSAAFPMDDQYDSDSESDAGSSSSEDNIEDVIEDLNTYMESLLDLSPSLDHPAVDTAHFENSSATLVDELSGVAEPARPFVLIIKDRYPSLEIGLVRKLGEANWQRRQRLREKVSAAPPMLDNPPVDDFHSSSGGTIVGDQPRSAMGGTPPASIVRSSFSMPTTYQSITTGSTFSEPSIFDNLSIHAPDANRPASFAESFTSFATSRADEQEYGQRRIPNMPDHEHDPPFQCHICGDVLEHIRHRADWK